MLTSDQLLLGKGRWLDHLSIIDYTGRDVQPRIYKAALELYGKPVCVHAAEVIAGAGLEGSTAVITTGFVLPPYNIAVESDGPSATLALARALIQAFGTKVLLVTDLPAVPVLQAGAHALGLNVVSEEALLALDRVTVPAVAIRALPFDKGEAQPVVTDILKRWSPKALIAVEKPGPNEHGIEHLLRGSSWAEHSAPAGMLFQQKAAGTVTVGFGDYGNEIGMGTLKETLKEVFPSGCKCTCGCNGTVFDDTVVDAVVPTANSTWGVFAVLGALATLVGKPGIMPKPEEEKRMIEAMVAAGMVDGRAAVPVTGVDGVSLLSDMAILQLMNEMIETYGTGLGGWKKPDA